MSRKSELENTGIGAIKLIQTSIAWTGKPLPPYPAGCPEVSIYKYTFPPHSVTNSHFHQLINCGVVLSGTLTIVTHDGRVRSFSEGEAIVETVGEVHHGENRGEIPAEVIMFYAGDASTPLSVAAELE